MLVFENKYSNCSSASNGLLVLFMVKRWEDRWKQRCWGSLNKNIVFCQSCFFLKCNLKSVDMQCLWSQGLSRGTRAVQGQAFILPYYVVLMQRVEEGKRLELGTSFLPLLLLCCCSLFLPTAQQTPFRWWAVNSAQQQMQGFLSLFDVSSRETYQADPFGSWSTLPTTKCPAHTSTNVNNPVLPDMLGQRGAEFSLH